MTAPTCSFCGAEMQPLPTDEVRDRIDQCGTLALPAESFECLAERCRARRIVTTRRIPGAAPVAYVTPAWRIA